MTKSYTYIRQWISVLLVLVLAACSSEQFESENGTLILREGEVALQWNPAQLGVYRVSRSRAGETTPKIPEETEIKTVHIFIFGPDGKYLSGGTNAFQGYKFLKGNSNYVLRTELFENEKNAADATVYAVANLPENQFGSLDPFTGIPEKVQEEKDLLAQVYTINDDNFTVNIPEGGIPMFGFLGADLSPDATKRILQVNLQSMMARIDLDFQMIPDQESDDGRNPSLVFNQVMVSGFPMGGTLQKQVTVNDMDSEDTEKGISLTDKREVEVKGLTGRAFRKGEPLEGIHLYMFEHSRNHKTVAEAFEGKGGKYPDGIDDPENNDPITDESRELKQRYKNYFANEGAACIILKGDYTNHNGYTYHVTYTLYPGASHIGEDSGAFTIKSNFLYKNRITVTGITVNNIGPEALLDTRVYIEESTNPYFIEMLRERKHDAHFNVTPMDIYKDLGSTVRVRILEPDKHRWIRMEPMSVVKENNQDLYASWTGEVYAKNAGDGKRKYFTTNLLSELDGQNYCTDYTTASTNDEERIYFYIDENTEGIENLPAVIPSREAIVEVTYTSPQRKVETRQIPIRQSGMRKVYFDKFADGGPYDENRTAYSFYIEEYEEYLQHYDGKNNYQETYNGLQWGFSGIETNLDGREWHTYLDYGWRNTMSIMKQFRNNITNPNEPEDIDLNTPPRGAAEYCYNKNKRNDKGQVETVHWYLPTISELEYALEEYYTAFTVFQNKWYWSSNPGCEHNDTGENPNYARATKVYNNPRDDEADDEGWVHYQSSANHPYPDKGGHALRTEEFRIRAAYIYKRPTGGYDNPPSLDNKNNL